MTAPDPGLFRRLSCFCTWGPKVAAHALDSGWYAPEQVAVTGAPRFDFYADTLVRLSTLHQGYDGCNGCPDRTIGRIRLRFGAEGHMARGVRAVFGLSAGELNAGT